MEYFKKLQWKICTKITDILEKFQEILWKI